MLCAKSSWNLNFVKVFSLFYIISPWKRAWYFFEQTRIPFIQVWCVPSLVEIDQKVLEIKDFLNFVSVFSLGKKALPFIWTNLNSPPPRMLFAEWKLALWFRRRRLIFKFQVKFGWNLRCGSGEERFLNFNNIFLLFAFIFTWKREWLFIRTNLNSIT